MSSFSWLHLTDLHRGMKNQRWAWPGVREIFFADLERLHEKSGPWDLVLFTGDLTQRGATDEFKEVDEILDQLWQHFRGLGSDPKLLAVPGNHDLARPTNMNDPSVLLLSQWEQQKGVQDAFWEDLKSPYRKVIHQAFDNYTAWWGNQPYRAENINPGILPGDFSVTIEKDGARLGIIGLNSAFLQFTGDNYLGKLALHTIQFHDTSGGDGPGWAKNHNACLLMTHHPPAWLNPESLQQLNGEITSHARFAVHLCGHMHETVFFDISEAGTESRRIFQGRSLFSLEYYGLKQERLHGYSVGKIELDDTQGKLMFWPRKARLQGGQRKIVPDYSINLTDDLCTEPVIFKQVSGNRSQPVEIVEPYRNSDIRMRYAHTPIKPAHFAGRITEVSQLSQALSNKTPCIIVILGMAGQGKTTLAYKVLQEMKYYDFTSGFWCTAYRGGYTFDMFLDSTLSYFLQEEYDARMFQTITMRINKLISILQEKPLLLVIDGFERWLRGWNESFCIQRNPDTFAEGQAIMKDWTIFYKVLAVCIMVAIYL
ncbi:metallophosphoesterase [Desulfobacterales bacterium HSG2]|nr:metallophosphoesterase [Desulfobacterales bacterium HSG2]